MDSIDIDTLKRSCKANNLSDVGTKTELWTRLKGGSGGDKKKAKKAAAPASTTADVGPPASYVAKEYASLKTAGFDDDDEINDLINKRWSKMQELKKATDSVGGGDKGKAKNVTEEVEMPVFLTEAQAANSNLQIKSPEPNDKGMYIYTRITGGSAAKQNKETLLHASNVQSIVKKLGDEVELLQKSGPPLKVEPAVKIEGKKAHDPDAASSGSDSRKRKWNFEQMDGFHEAAAVWASKTIENRLMDKKRQKQNLANFCPDFNIPVVEVTKKRWMAQELARNLLQYTDDEEEDE